MVRGLDAMPYAAANARVRGLASRLLADDAWAGLLGGRTLLDALALLKNTPYADVIAQAEQGGAVVLERIEQHLLGRAAANYRRAMRLTNGPVRALLMLWWQRFEVRNLKALFRGCEHHMEADSIARFLIPLGDYSTLPWDALLHEQSVLGLIERLSATHYINPLRNALPVYQREGSLFPLEVALDVRYYRDIAAAIHHLGGEENAVARRILGTHLDMLNILWAFRYRVYYGFSAEEIVNYTLWRTFRTDTDLVRTIALGADPRAILERVWGAGAIDASLLDEATDDFELLSHLELTFQRHWYSLAAREMLGYPFGLGAILGYLVLQELEIQDLVTTLEGKSMGWELERIQRYLVRHKG